MARFTGSFNLNDLPSLSINLEKASDNQLTFWYAMAKQQKLEKARQLIMDEMVNRSVDTYQHTYRD